MKKYTVTVFCEFEVEVEVEAPDLETAEQLAEEQVATTYGVFQKDLEEPMPFDDIIAYVPKDK